MVKQQTSTTFAKVKKWKRKTELTKLMSGEAMSPEAQNSLKGEYGVFNEEAQAYENILLNGLGIRPTDNSWEVPKITGEA